MIYIGIDAGTHTGLAVWDSKEQKFLMLQTTAIHKALDIVRNMSQERSVYVFVEDARHISHKGWDSEARKQGAGSVKRDCSIWEDFLTDYKIPFQFVRPHKGTTKATPEYFRMVTGYTKRTSNHARDAAMLVYGR